jgi:HSP20 family protein
MVEETHSGSWLPSLYGPLRTIGQKVVEWFAPRSDASALDDYYEINVELPGVKSEDVEVQVRDNTLSVRGEKHSEREEKGRTYFFSEREYGAFQRTFPLPPDADSQKIDAAFDDGVLRLRIARQAGSKSAAKQIKIQTT